MFKHILVPLDGSALAERALEKAKELAVENEAKLTILSVFEPEQTLAAPSSRLDTYHLVVSIDAVRERAETYLDAQKETLVAEFPNVETAILQRVDRVGEMIASYAADHEVDLIVMTSHGYTGVRRWILGSVTTDTICEATCPIMVLPASGATS